MAEFAGAGWNWATQPSCCRSSCRNGGPRKRWGPEARSALCAKTPWRSIASSSRGESKPANALLWETACGSCPSPTRTATALSLQAPPMRRRKRSWKSSTAVRFERPPMAQPSKSMSAPPAVCLYRILVLPFILLWYLQRLACLYLVWVIQLIAIRLVNLHVLIRISVDLLTDF